MHLPLTHVTPWEKFLKIVDSGYLKPQPCRHFKKDILYLNYGRLAHKPSDKNYNWLENAPVIFFLQPSAISKCSNFYPFDTGAVITGRFRKTDLNFSTLKSDYAHQVYGCSSPAQLVNKLYAEPTYYINQRTPTFKSASGYAAEVLGDMYNLAANAKSELDYRLTSIECHAVDQIAISQSLAIALPEYMADVLPVTIKKSNLNLHFYKDRSIDSFLPQDLSNYASQLFLNYSQLKKYGLSN